jgi:hypothetical protein
MLSVIMLSVIMLSVIMLSVVMLNVVLLSVIMLNAVAPFLRVKIALSVILKNFHQLFCHFLVLMRMPHLMHSGHFLEKL